tara:strand:- start:132 stop:1133 length:1002 start_codon:yes stop_codon:yes gene_type:complete
MDFRNLARTWIAAEIGVNHEGDMSVAEDLIRKAADCGADSVKFQTYTPEGYVAADQPERREAVAGRMLSREEFSRLADVAKEAGITFFSTPLGLDDVEFLDGIAPIFKVASGELTYLQLIQRIAQTGKPVIISTGLGLKDEIAAAIETVLSERPDAAEKGELLIMHCVSAYPTPDAQAHLRNITWLQDNFGLPVGYSDHTLGIKACELAIAVGAVALEKHFTYRKEDQEFRDHQLSADPKDLRALVEAIRTAETYLGRYDRERGSAELENMEAARRSLAAAVDIPADTPIKREWLTGLRPLWGIPSEKMESIVGERLKRPISEGFIIKQEDIA